jgi:hypothetical protein
MFVRARTAEQLEARRLRAEGWSLRRIARALGVSLSSASLWVRDVEVPPGPEQTAPAPAAETGPPSWCPRCRRHLAASAFNAGQGYCKPCFRAYHQQHPRDRARENQMKRARVEAARRIVMAHLGAAACAECGEADPAILELDHVGEKRCDIADLVNRGAREATLIDELSRCEVVCANCHRRRTASRGRWRRLDLGDSRSWRSPLQELNVLHAYCALLVSGCVECGERDLVLLDFDHVGAKTANVMDLARREYAFARVLAEIEQCVVRCANCHRRRTARDGAWYRTRAS